MASIHRSPGCRNWFAAFIGPHGRRCFKSTGTHDRGKAKAIAAQYEEAARLGRDARLTESAARRVIANLFEIANRDSLPHATVREYVGGWLQRKSLEVAESSLVEYQRLAGDFLKGLGARADRPMDAVTPADVVKWRDRLSARVSAGTVNKGLKALRGAWTAAVREGLIQANVFAQVETVRDATAAKRRAFTMDELKRILAVCDTEWRGIVTAGIYTGQRLSDLVTLRWSQIDLSTDEVRFPRIKKTGATMVLPLAEPFKEYLISLPSSDDPAAYLFPVQAAAVAVNQSTVSRRFTHLLASAGLVKFSDDEKAHKATRKGRDARRRSGGLSFHCIRHTAASLLADAGVSDIVAREIIGHKSEAVARVYRHIGEDAKRAAIGKMPDVRD
jgi:integrase